jgi:hypothetical protein
MDVHSVEGGVSASDVAAAHQADLATQGTHGVNYLRYWVDPTAGKIFCLVEAPDAEAANAVHREGTRACCRRDLPRQRTRLERRPSSGVVSLRGVASLV